jgi:hypothetical protein
MIPSSLAIVDPEVIAAVMVPLVFLMIPIVAILARHQQKMAEIIHRGSGGEDMAALRREIGELKTLMHSQAIALDNLAGTQKALSAPPPAPSISERLNS